MRRDGRIVGRQHHLVAGTGGAPADHSLASADDQQPVDLYGDFGSFFHHGN